MDRLEKHQPDYKPGAWNNYTIQELGNWVYLFSKRASHRTNMEKAKKDLYDAKNYLFMMKQQLEKICTQVGTDFDEL